MTEIKKCCGNCSFYLKISKQFGSCLATKCEIMNANTGQINNIYVRVAKYNFCNNHKSTT